MRYHMISTQTRKFQKIVYQFPYTANMSLGMFAASRIPVTCEQVTATTPWPISIQPVRGLNKINECIDLSSFSSFPKYSVIPGTIVSPSLARFSLGPWEIKCENRSILGELTHKA